jgi:hypothetical protein
MDYVTQNPNNMPSAPPPLRRVEAANATAAPTWYEMAVTEQAHEIPNDDVHGASSGSYLQSSSRSAAESSSPWWPESSNGSVPAWYDKYAAALPTPSPRVESVIDCFSLARHNRMDHIADLLNRGLAADVRDEFGNTMLAIACQNGNRRLVKLLLRNGADINVRNHRGNTPLHFVCRYFGSDSPLAAYLLAKGADPGVRNSEGETCFGVKSNVPRR